MSQGAGKCVVVAGCTSAGLAGLHRLSWRSGVASEEAFGPLPGDDVIAHPMLEWTRGITIERPASQVRPWLAQMGYHRGGWYTNWIGLFGGSMLATPIPFCPSIRTFR